MTGLTKACKSVFHTIALVNSVYLVEITRTSSDIKLFIVIIICNKK